MSGFLSSRYLMYRSLEQHEKIDRDLFCAGCGYNVRGLNFGRNCPECGAPIEPGDVEDLLLSSSAAERSAWRFGLALGPACLAAVVIARLGLLVAGFGGIGTGLKAGYLGTGLALGILWAAAAWAMTPKRLEERWAWMKAPRRFVRASQLLWPLAYACWMAAALGGMPGMLWPARIGRLVAGFGVIVLAMILSRVAERSDREDAARRFNAAAWLLPIATLLPQAFPGIIAWFTLVPLGVCLLFWAWVMLVFARGLLGLHRHLSWAASLAANRHTRAGRIARSREEMARELEASVRPVQPPLPDLPFDPPSE